MKKQELLDKLVSSEELIKMAYLPLHQVIEWVKELDDNETTINWDNLKADLTSEISDLGLDIIDDYELEMSYREVELSSVELNENRIEQKINNVINHFITTEG